MKKVIKTCLVIAVALAFVASLTSHASGNSNELVPTSFLGGGFQQAFFNNRPLSLDVHKFSSYYLTRSGPQSAELRIGSTAAIPIAATIRADGSIVPNGKATCGLLDSYNFVSVVTRDAPDYIDQTSKWSAVIPIQFVDCSNSTVSVNVSVERLLDDRLQLLVEGKKGGPIRYEGNPSSSHLKLEIRIQFVAGKLLECDGSALEDLDSVKGHSSWMLASIPAPS